MISFGICKSIQKNVEMCRNKSIFYESCAKETEMRDCIYTGFLLK